MCSSDLIPYKQQIVDFLSECSDEATAIGAVNTLVPLPGGGWRGENTDVYGFMQALTADMVLPERAIVLGNGGAALAVRYGLEKEGIQVVTLSRKTSVAALKHINIKAYNEFNTLDLAAYPLIVNTTPLGTSPHTNLYPLFPYHKLTASHYLFDLIYNPEITQFMQLGIRKKCRVQNGYAMLVGQAEKAWQLWNAAF